MIEDSVLDLVAALHLDQGLTCSDNFETYDLGKYIYSIQVANSLNGTIKVDIHVQWPRLYHWALQAQQEGKALIWSCSSLEAESVLVYVRAVDSIINYTAIVDAQTLRDLLWSKEIVADDKLTAEELFEAVRTNGCL